MKRPMIFLGLAAVIALVIVSSVAAQPGDSKRTTTKTDRLDFGPGGRVSLSGAPKGSITIAAAAGSEVSITAVVTATGADQAQLEKLTTLTGFVTKESLGLTSILTFSPDTRDMAKKSDRKLLKSLVGIPYTVDYTITVPRYCDLDISGGIGPITVSGVEGNLHINSVEGDVVVDLIGGGLTATVGKGTLTFTMPNRSWRGGSIEASVGNGMLTANLPQMLSAEVDASILRTGAIENGFSTFKPKDRKIPFTDHAVIGKAGVGGITLKLTVGDGTLKLVPLDNKK